MPPVVPIVNAPADEPKAMLPIVRPESIVIGLPDVPKVPTAVLKVAVSVFTVAPEFVPPGAVPPQLLVSFHAALAPPVCQVALAAEAEPVAATTAKRARPMRFNADRRKKVESSDGI